MLAFVYKLVESAANSWNRIPGLERIAQIITGMRCVDGKSELETDKISPQEQDGRFVA
jgi:hypothetical protein